MAPTLETEIQSDRLLDDSMKLIRCSFASLIRKMLPFRGPHMIRILEALD